MCCSMLQCDAVFCSGCVATLPPHHTVPILRVFRCVLQCAAGCCSASQSVTVCLKYFAVFAGRCCCSTIMYLFCVRCSVLQCVAICYGVVQCLVVLCSVCGVMLLPHQNVPVLRAVCVI